MPKTPRLTSKQVIKFLEQSGFVLDHVSGSHYVYYHSISKRRVVVPFHNKNLPIGTLKSILQMAEIEDEF